MVAHVSSASDISESVSMTEKIIDNEVSEVESILKAFTGSEHLKPLNFHHSNYSLLALSLQTMCAFLLSFIAIMLL